MGDGSADHVSWGLVSLVVLLMHSGEELIFGVRIRIAIPDIASDLPRVILLPLQYPYALIVALPCFTTLLNFVSDSIVVSLESPVTGYHDFFR